MTIAGTDANKSSTDAVNRARWLGRAVEAICGRARWPFWACLPKVAQRARWCSITSWLADTRGTFSWSDAVAAKSQAQSLINSRRAACGHRSRHHHGTRGRFERRLSNSVLRGGSAALFHLLRDSLNWGSRAGNSSRRLRQSPARGVSHFSVPTPSATSTSSTAFT